MKNVMRMLTLLLALALLLCAAGCKKEAAAGATAPQTTTQATQESQEATTGEDTATEATASTEATETTASAPAQTQEQPADQESEVEFNETVEWEEEFLDEQIGIGPRITVTWETYENMSEAEQEAYRACFTTDLAFSEWENMAMLDYDTFYDEPLFMGSGTLNLKEIVESLTGKTFE